MKDYNKIEVSCIDNLEIDLMPLHDLIREFSGYDKPPTEDDFVSAMKFLKYLSNKYDLKYLEGPEMIEINKSASDIIDWLTKNWYSNKYNEINYGIWLKKG
ncbi:MAG TPA: hypothetical protein P5512_05905 [Chitinophagales bacterium]|nr:hypothetical protein [Chitinophagales bacterium]HRX23656.1 hypothetical protein [Chitinophagales bacterium]